MKDNMFILISTYGRRKKVERKSKQQKARKLNLCLLNETTALKECSPIILIQKQNSNHDNNFI